jgi:MFS family permease
MNISKNILLIVTGLFWFSMYTYVPILAPYAQSLGASYDMVGLIIGSYGLTQLLLRIPIGLYSDAWGRRKFFIISGLAFALLSNLGMWLVPAVGILLLGRAVSGVAASTWVDFTVLYASYFPGKDSPKAIGYLNAACNLGQVIAMLAGGYLAQHTEMVATFILSVVFGGAGLFLCVYIKEEYVTPKPLNTTILYSVLKDGDLLRLSGLGIVIQVVTFVTVFGFLPVFAQGLGADNFELSLLTTATMIPSVFSSAMSGSFFGKRYGERFTLVSGFAIVTVTCLAIPFISNLSMLYISQALGGFGRGLVLPLLMGLSIKNFADDRRSTAMGVFQAIYGLGMFGGPVLVGVLSNSFNLATGFIVTGIIGLFGVGLAAWRRYLPLDHNVH